MRDPTDPNYSEVPVPKFPKLPPVKPVPNTGLTAAVASATNAVIANQAEAIGFLKALLTALDRSDEAAKARDTAAEERQEKAAQDFARNLAEIFKRSATLQLALANKWTGPDLNVSISQKDALKIRDDVIINGFSSQFLDILKKIEPNRKKRDALEKRIMIEIVKIPDRSLRTGFRNVLKDAKLRAAPEHIGFVSIP